MKVSVEGEVEITTNLVLTSVLSLRSKSNIRASAHCIIIVQASELRCLLRVCGTWNLGCAAVGLRPR
jgi:hypothetical protein